MSTTAKRCKRVGCFRQAMRQAHDPHEFTADGQPVHGRFVADGREVKADGSLVHLLDGGEPLPFWDVRLEAVGDGPWLPRVEVSGRAWPDPEPRMMYGTFALQDAPGLLRALLDATWQAGRLDAGLPADSLTERLGAADAAGLSA